MKNAYGAKACLFACLLACFGNIYTANLGYTRWFTKINNNPNCQTKPIK